jgi:hypothetical protein
VRSCGQLSRPPRVRPIAPPRVSRSGSRTRGRRLPEPSGPTAPGPTHPPTASSAARGALRPEPGQPSAGRRAAVSAAPDPAWSPQQRRLRAGRTGKKSGARSITVGRTRSAGRAPAPRRGARTGLGTPERTAAGSSIRLTRPDTGARRHSLDEEVERRRQSAGDGEPEVEARTTLSRRAAEGRCVRVRALGVLGVLRTSGSDEGRGGLLRAPVGRGEAWARREDPGPRGRGRPVPHGTTPGQMTQSQV